MKNKAIAAMILFVIVLFVIIVITKNRTEYNSIENYKIVTVLKDLKGDSLGYFYKPNYLQKYDDKIIAADRANHRIVLLDSNLNFIQSYGKKGRGPGEILSISYVRFKNNIIHIADAGNQKIIQYDIKGNLLGETKLNLFPVSNFVITKDGSYLISDNLHGNLFSEYNLKAELIGRYGSQKKFNNPELEKIRNLVLLETDDNNNIFAAFYGMPYLRKYNSKKELEWETDLSNIKEIQEVYDNIIRQEKQTAKYSYRSLITNLRYFSNTIYIIVSKVTGDGVIYGLNSTNGKLKEKIQIENNKYITFDILFQKDKLFFADEYNNLVVKCSKVK